MTVSANTKHILVALCLMGAALLASEETPLHGKGERIEPQADPIWAAYVSAWRAAVEARGANIRA